LKKVRSGSGKPQACGTDLEKGRAASATEVAKKESPFLGGFAVELAPAVLLLPVVKHA